MLRRVRRGHPSQERGLFLVVDGCGLWECGMNVWRFLLGGDFDDEDRNTD